MKKTIWNLKKGEKYWVIFSNGDIACEKWADTEWNRKRVSSFNAFLTREEAESELKERKKKALSLKPILDDAEWRYLKAVIRPFRDRVKYIRKSVCLSKKESYIAIKIDDDYLFFPSFKIDTMYQGMELDRKYTLEELGV